LTTKTDYVILLLCLSGGIGRHRRLTDNLSTLREISCVNPVKFGETFKMAIPSEARKGTCRDLTAGS